MRSKDHIALIGSDLCHYLFDGRGAKAASTSLPVRRAFITISLAEMPPTSKICDHGRKTSHWAEPSHSINLNLPRHSFHRKGATFGDQSHRIGRINLFEDRRNTRITPWNFSRIRFSERSVKTTGYSNRPSG